MTTKAGGVWKLRAAPDYESERNRNLMPITTNRETGPMTFRSLQTKGQPGNSLTVRQSSEAA